MSPRHLLASFLCCCLAACVYAQTIVKKQEVVYLSSFMAVPVRNDSLHRCRWTYLPRFDTLPSMPADTGMAISATFIPGSLPSAHDSLVITLHNNTPLSVKPDTCYEFFRLDSAGSWLPVFSYKGLGSARRHSFCFAPYHGFMTSVLNRFCIQCHNGGRKLLPGTYMVTCSLWTISTSCPGIDILDFSSFRHVYRLRRLSSNVFSVK